MRNIFLPRGFRNLDGLGESLEQNPVLWVLLVLGAGAFFMMIHVPDCSGTARVQMEAADIYQAQKQGISNKGSVIPQKGLFRADGCEGVPPLDYRLITLFTSVAFLIAAAVMAAGDRSGKGKIPDAADRGTDDTAGAAPSGEDAALTNDPEKIIRLGGRVFKPGDLVLMDRKPMKPGLLALSGVITVGVFFWGLYMLEQSGMQLDARNYVLDVLRASEDDRSATQEAVLSIVLIGIAGVVFMIYALFSRMFPLRRKPVPAGVEVYYILARYVYPYGKGLKSTISLLVAAGFVALGWGATRLLDMIDLTQGGVADIMYWGGMMLAIVVMTWGAIVVPLQIFCGRRVPLALTERELEAAGVKPDDIKRAPRDDPDWL